MKPREHSGRPWRRRMARYGWPGDGHGRADGGAQREAAVGGKVANVQHGVAEEQRQDRQAVDEAQLQSRLEQIQNGSVHKMTGLLSPSFRLKL